MKDRRTGTPRNGRSGSGNGTEVTSDSDGNDGPTAAPVRSSFVSLRLSLASYRLRLAETPRRGRRKPEPREG